MTFASPLSAPLPAKRMLPAEESMLLGLRGNADGRKEERRKRKEERGKEKEEDT